MYCFMPLGLYLHAYKGGIRLLSQGGHWFSSEIYGPYEIESSHQQSV